MTVLGLVAGSCGGLDTRFRTELAEPAAERGWRLAITLTPTAARWLDHAGEIPKLQALTDLPVRSESRLPDEPRPHPDPGVFLFAPASANSVAKLALGIADNQALTVLGDVLGDPRVRIVVRYLAQPARSRHPAWQGHLAALASAGADVSQLVEPWSTALDGLTD
ncbi:flavoprotein [Amycolatopsis pithecellobii]|uniref:Flavoprotein n=1 Tax=Amycolatopsis pithecellobii TaxID=664692 RepID=A0A6N7YS91_9PSEU|nr:flavoprotein [Amycolatopsis pithecellobii]MTD55907.1 flavoprotein [Amycolatopsis pithecellobii]